MVKDIRKKLLKTIFLIAIIVMIIIPKQEIAASNIMLGDINGDKIVDSRDMLAILRHIAANTNKKHSEWELKEEKLEAADVTKDGKVDAEDMLLVLRYIAASNSETINKKHPEWIEFKKKETVKEIKEQETKQEEKTKVEQETKQETKQEEIKQQEIKQEQEKTKQEETKQEQEEPKQEETKKQEEQITKPEVKINATNVSLMVSNATLNTGSTARLVATVLPYNVTDGEVEWTNSNPASVAIEKVIEAGTYYIESALDNNKVIDISGESTANGAKVQLYNRNKSTGQQFEIVSVADGYYTIKAKCSNLMLDVKGAEKTAGTKVQQYKANGTDFQKWEFEYAGNGYYYIKSKCNGLYLDVKGGKTDNGTQIQVYTENRSNAQKFKLEVIKKKSIIVEEGTYRIKSALNENKAIDISEASTVKGAKVQIYNKNETIAQKFELISLGNGYYKIRAKCSNQMLDVKDRGQTSGTKVQQWTSNTSDAQIWKIESAGNGYYYIKSKCNGLYLDVKGGKSDNGTELQVYTGNKSNAQKFKLDKISEEVNKNISIVTIKAKKKGTATITVKTNNGKKETCKVTVEESFPNESSKIAYQRIQNMSSSTKYLVAIDYDRNYMHVFKGSAGSWKIEKSFRCVTGPKRYFGDEKKRMAGTTPMMKSKLRGKFKVASDNPSCIFCVAMNSPGTCRDYIHGYISPGIKGNASPYTYGSDIAAKRIATGKLRASNGCIELIRKDAIWFYENAALVDTTCYVWTEKPATSNDRFENTKLKNIMIKKGYYDVNQLTASEKEYVYK